MLLVVGSERVSTAAVAGTALVVAVELPLAVAQVYRASAPLEFWLPYLLEPLGHVAVVLAVATAVWVAYRGRFERLRGLPSVPRAAG